MISEHKFPFAPTLRQMKFDGKPSTRYSSVFAEAISVAGASYDASTIKTTRSNVWKQRPPLDISYVPSADAFPPLATKPNLVSQATPSTTSETFDEDTIQSAISTAIKTLQDQHRVELEILKKDMQQKLDKMEQQMKELGQQVAVQTYKALVNEESPLVTKADHAHLQHEMNVITSQLSTLIRMFKQSNDHAGSSKETNSSGTENTSPPRTGKRLKQNRTPEKAGLVYDLFTQDSNGSSATSDPDEGMEGCET